MSRLSKIQWLILSNKRHMVDGEVNINRTYIFFSGHEQGSGYVYLSRLGVDIESNPIIRMKLVQLLLDEDLSCLD